MYYSQLQFVAVHAFLVQIPLLGAQSSVSCEQQCVCTRLATPGCLKVKAVSLPIVAGEDRKQGMESFILRVRWGQFLSLSGQR